MNGEKRKSSGELAHQIEAGHADVTEVAGRRAGVDMMPYVQPGKEADPRREVLPSLNLEEEDEYKEVPTPIKRGEIKEYAINSRVPDLYGKDHILKGEEQDP